MFDPHLPFRHFLSPGSSLSGDAIVLKKGWKPPRVNTRLADGTTVQERKPSAPCILLLHPCGSVYEGVFGPGSGRRQPNDPQENRVLWDKVQLGHLPYGRCPKAMGLHEHLPAELRDGPPCKAAKTADGTLVPIGPEHPCDCIRKLEAIRKAKQRAVTDHEAARYKQDGDKVLESAERREEMLAEALAKQAAAMEKLAEITEAQTRGKK